MNAETQKADIHIERILKAAGSAMRHYTPQSQEGLRKAMIEIIAEIEADCRGNGK